MPPVAPVQQRTPILNRLYFQWQQPDGPRNDIPNAEFKIIARTLAVEASRNGNQREAALLNLVSRNVEAIDGLDGTIDGRVATGVLGTLAGLGRVEGESSDDIDFTDFAEMLTRQRQNPPQPRAQQPPVGGGAAPPQQAPQLNPQELELQQLERRLLQPPPVLEQLRRLFN